MRVVYLDTVLVVNLLIDYILLHLTSKFLLIKTSVIKMALSSAIGAFSAVILTLFVKNRFLTFAFSFLSLYIMSIIAFGKIKRKIRIRQVTVMYIFSYLLCGFESSIMPLFNGFEIKYKAVILTAGAIAFTYFAKIAVPLFRNRTVSKSVEAIIEFEACSFRLKLLVDSGNLLIDNVSRLPVIFINRKNNVDNTYPIIFRMMDKSFLAWGRVPRKIIIKQNDAYKEINCCVAFMTDDNNFSGYDGIIPQNVLQNI